NWRVLGVRIARFQGADDHLTRVYAYANFYRYPARLEKSVAITANFLLHPESSVKRALRMVLVRRRSSEQSEDPVSGALYVAIVAAGSIDHNFQSRVDDGPGLLRVEVLLQLGRTLDVSEQDRYELALAVDRRGRAIYRYRVRYRNLSPLCAPK